jgi:hypothetical protein
MQEEISLVFNGKGTYINIPETIWGPKAGKRVKAMLTLPVFKWKFISVGSMIPAFNF